MIIDSESKENFTNNLNLPPQEINNSITQILSKEIPKTK